MVSPEPVALRPGRRGVAVLSTCLGTIVWLLLSGAALTSPPQADTTGGIQTSAPVALVVDGEPRISDGNGVFELGERVEVVPTWLNGDLSAQTLIGTASDFTGPPGPIYSIAVDHADYGQIEPGESTSCQSTGMCYELDIGPVGVERPKGHWDSTFVETLSDDTTLTWTLHIGDSFVDVQRETSFYRSIETVLHHGVTSGCTGTQYCPVSVSSRAQMPAFVLRALEGPDYMPLPCEAATQVFSDVSFDSPFCPWIEELFHRGVVAGCGGGKYCPANPTSRAQVAVFLLKTLEGADYTPPGCTGLFADVPCLSPFAAWIEELHRRGITSGCSTDPLEYCPGAPTIRQQMAVFITRTFGLTLYGPDAQNNPPVVSPETFTLEENSADGTAVGTVTVTDPNAGQSHTFAITAGNTDGAFAIEPSTGELTVADDSALDFETTPTFALTVEATDDGTPPASGSATVTVELIDVNDLPEVTPETFTLAEGSANGTAVGTVTFTDPDAGQSHTFAITAGNTDGAFAIEPSTGELTVANDAALDFETNPSFALTVEVTDDGTPPLSGSATVTVELSDGNDSPEVTPATLPLAENSAAGTVVGTVSFTDPDAGQSHTFAITAGNTDGAFAIAPSTGELTVANSAALDFETNPTFALTVEVTDDGTPPLSGSATVTVELTDVNELPEVTPATFGLAENSAVGTVAGTVSFTDADAGQSHTFAITAGNTDGAFTIGASTGELTVANSAALDFETTPTFALTVEVTDDGTPPLSGSATVTVELTDLNEPPTAVDDVAGTDEDTAIVVAVLANDIDPDTGDTLLIVAIGGSPMGQVVNNGSDVTYDPTAVFDSLPVGGSANDSFTYTIEDSGGLSSTATVTVTVSGLNDAPVAGDDAYSAIGNTQLAVEKDGPFDTPTFSSSLADVLENDADPDVGDTVSVVPFSDTLPSGAELDLAADGSFFYTPPPGQTTPDTFNYTVEDSFGGTGFGEVTIDLTKRVWYVDNTTDGGTPGTGSGTATEPFSTLSDGGGNTDPDDAEDASAAGDILYVLQGDGTATNQDAGIALKTAQRLLGEGVDLVVDPDDGGPEPPATLFAGDPATRPHVTHSGDGSAVAVLANTANGDRVGLEIRGLVLSSTGSNAVEVTSANAVNLDVRIADNVVAGAGGAGIDVNVGSSSATQTLALHDNTVTASSNGIDIFRTAGTLTITAFGNNTVTGATGFGGISVTGDDVIFDAVPGGSFDTVDGGSLTIGTSGDAVGGGGMTLAGVSGDLSYTSIDIHAGGGPGLRISGTGSYTGAAGTRFRNLTAGTGVIEAVGGAAVDLDPITADLRLATISSSNSPGSGVRLANLVDGTGTTAQFSAGAGSSISNAAGTAFLVNGGNATIAYGGTISNSSGRSVVVQNRTADTATFTGNVNDSGTGILLSSNAAGSTTSFRGGMTLSTGSNPAFTATNGGTVDVCDENPCNPGSTGGLVNTLTTTTGTALNVTNTTIGANNLELRSISAGTGASGPTNGIVLNNTGSSGGLKVKGTGSAGSGGTIQNCTGDGISLASTAHVDLSHVIVTNGDDDGIDGSSVINFSLANSNVTNNGDVANEEGISFSNLSGTVSMANVTATGNAYNNLRIDNTSGTISSLSISGGSYSNNQAGVGNHGILIEPRGSSQITSATVDGATLSGNEVMGIQVATADTAVVSSFTVSGNTIQNNELGIDFSKAQTSSLTFRIENNTGMTGQNSHGINLFTAVGAGTTGSFRGRIQNNTIGNAAVDGSGSVIGNCIRVNINGDTNADVLIDGNELRECPNGRGIEVIGRNGTGGLDVTVTNNDVDHTNLTFPPSGDFPLSAILVQSNCATVCNTVRSDVRGNTVPAGSGFDLLPTYIALVETSTSTLQLVDTAPADANCTDQLTSTNTGSASANAGCALTAGPIDTPP